MKAEQWVNLHAVFPCVWDFTASWAMTWLHDQVERQWQSWELKDIHRLPGLQSDWNR